MKAAGGFVFVRQSRPANCSAVALTNAMRWLGCTVDLQGLTGGTSYRAVAPWCQVTHELDCLLPSMAPAILFGPLVAQALAGWVAVVDIRSPWTPGGRHAVALVDADEAWRVLVLDGKADGPEWWERSRLAAAQPCIPLLLRRERREVPS